MVELNSTYLKAAINTALGKYESYWGYREDKQGEIVESVFKEILNKQKIHRY